MKLIFTSYASSPAYSQPNLWLKRIEGYTGILENLGRNNTVVGIERINYEGECKRNGVQYLFTRLNRKIVRFPFRMHGLIKKLKPDVVFINGFIFPLQIIQLRMTLGSSVKIIVLHRAEKPFKGIKRYLQKMADKAVDAYLFTSLEFGNDWKKNINVKKIHEVIQASSNFSPMNKSDAREKTNINGDPAFLWVGTLIPRKDPLTVVKAFLEFSMHQPVAKLYMIFQSATLLEEIELLLNKNQQYRDNIILVGSIPHDQLLYWYNSADFFISASNYEGSGVALSEAMSCGCIPITSDFISSKKMTGPGKCGLLFRTGDAQDLLSALLATKKMDKANEQEKVLQQFNKELSFEAIVNKINNVINSI